MQKISASTNTANAEGEFTEGSAAAGVAATLIKAAWLNSVQRELTAVIAAAGIDLDIAKDDQLLSAIKAINKQSVMLADVGTAGAYKAVNSPALTALPGTGFIQCINIANVNPGASTYSPDGQPAKPIYGLGLQPLQGGELAVGPAIFYYLVKAGVNGGDGAWIVLYSLGGASQIAPATQSQHAVQQGQVQAQSGTAFATGGAAPTLTLTPAPAIAAYAANQRFRVRFGAASTGADTLNVSGRGAKALKQYDSIGAKVPAVFSSGVLSDVEFDGTDFVLLDQLPSLSGVTQPQFNKSTNLATTAFLKSRGNEYSVVMGVSGSSTLNLGIIGGLLVLGGAGTTTTLPPAASVPVGGQITIEGLTDMSVVNTIRCAGSDVLAGVVNGTGLAAAAMNIAGGDTFTLVSDGTSVWHVVTNVSANFINAQFWKGQSLVAAGYQKMPGGLILQWGSYSFTASGTQSFSVPLPIAFPNATLAISSTTASRLNNTAAGFDVSASSKSALALSSITASGSGVSVIFYMAWGF